MIIRRANQNDLNEIARLNKLLTNFNEKVLDVHEPLFTEEVTLKYVTDFFNEPNSIFFVAEQDKKVIGYISGRIEDNIRGYKEMNMEEIIVEEDYRGQKIGKLLFEELEKEAKDQNCIKIISSIFSNNNGSENFHLKQGFKVKYYDTILEKEL